MSRTAENIGPLGDAGLLQHVDGEAEIVPGVRVVPTPGHTRGHQSVLVGTRETGQALFLGDVVPTAVHTRLPWVMAYDLEPARTLETKRALFRRALDEDWLLLWGHDRDHTGGRLGLDKDGNTVVRELVTI
jgi:glyoxylase-like metal-dependent hydrolase (beta-lactamase superfamily II)